MAPAARLFTLVYGIGTLVTIFMSNDATAVVLTPAILTAVRKAKVEPLPYLFACALIANAASFVLPISNPANLVVFHQGMPPLGQWLLSFGVPSLLSIVRDLRWPCGCSSGRICRPRSRSKWRPSRCDQRQAGPGRSRLHDRGSARRLCPEEGPWSADLPGRACDHRGRLHQSEEQSAESCEGDQLGHPCRWLPACSSWSMPSRASAR